MNKPKGNIRFSISLSNEQKNAKAKILNHAFSFVVGKAGSGNIALQTKGDSKFSYLVLWPHIRSWKISKPEPTLRALPDVQSVAQILAKAAKARIVEVENKEQPNSPELGAVV